MTELEIEEHCTAMLAEIDIREAEAVLHVRGRAEAARAPYIELMRTIRAGRQDNVALLRDAGGNIMIHPGLFA